MPRLIGINGFRTSGKDTTFKLIRDSRPNLRVDRVAFADNLKLLGAKALGFTGTDAELIDIMDEFKESGVVDVAYDENGYAPRGTHITGRQYLQNLGANARTVFHDSFWVDQVLPNPKMLGWQDVPLLEASYPLSDILCVTDVRYANEAQRVLDLGGEVWEIVRPGIETDGHSSEQPLPRELVTEVIQNDSTLDVLLQRVEDRLSCAE